MAKLPPSMILTFFVATTPTLFAQDPHDEEIFGGPAAAPATAEPPSTFPPASAEKPQSSSLETSLADRLQIGGRLDWGTTMTEKDGTSFAKGEFRQTRRADIYFDSRTDDGRSSPYGLRGVRGFFRLRFLDESPPPVRSPEINPRTLVDELWFKNDFRRQVFFTVGRQHLKWGSGRLWNPTDFPAAESRDPFALFDARLGQDLVKVHIPFEKGGHNLYLILDTHQVARTDDAALLGRGELSLGTSSELALSIRKSRKGPDKLGLDWSGALGPFDLYTETALVRRSSQIQYSGSVLPVATSNLPTASTLELPTAAPRQEKTFRQSVVGVQYGLKYQDDDTITFTLEYFYNERGYKKRDLGLYALARGQETPLTVGRQAVGFFVQAPSPGSWNDLTLALSGIKNLVDFTSTTRLSASYSLFKELTLQTYINRCFGDVGALCFRIPEAFKQLAADPRLSAEDRALLGQLPSKRTLTVMGVNFVLNL